MSTSLKNRLEKIDVNILMNIERDYGLGKDIRKGDSCIKRS